MSPEERAREIAARYVSHSGMREQCEDEIEQAIRAAVAEEREAYQCVVDAIEGVFGLIDARKADWPDRDPTRPLARSADGARHPRGAAAMSAWQPIDTAPRDGRDIILGYAGSHSEEGRWMGDPSRNHWRETGWFASTDDVLCNHPKRPTHWQPLPAPPEG